MSGHSKWSTIKRKKEATDQARGKLFSKLSRAISIAIKTGGGADPDTNHKLRVAIEAAKSSNMPKANIERAISKGGGGESLEEGTYEGFGPEGINVIAEVATDNRNRTGQELKGIFERGGGRMAGPGAVSFNFEPKGLLVIEKKKDIEGQMLELIDLGAEDVEETTDGIEVYLDYNNLSDIKDKIVKNEYKITSTELVQKPKVFQKVEAKEKAKKIISFLEKLEDHDDVQKVFANIDIPDDILNELE